MNREKIGMLGLGELRRVTDVYFEKLKDFMSSHRLEDLLAPPVDYIAIKCADSRDYETYLYFIKSLTLKRSEVMLQGRRITNLVLISPISFGDLGETCCLEVIEPKPEKVGHDLAGFEHIEIYNPDLENVEAKLRDVGVTYERGGNEYHNTIVVKINEQGQEVKFTSVRLADLKR